MVAEAREIVSTSVRLPISEHEIKDLPNYICADTLHGPKSTDEFINESHYGEMVNSLRSGHPVTIEPYQNVRPVYTRDLLDDSGLPDIFITYTVQGTRQLVQRSWYVGFCATRDVLLGWLGGQNQTELNRALQNFQPVTVVPQS